MELLNFDNILFEKHREFIQQLSEQYICNLFEEEIIATNDWKFCEFIKEEKHCCFEVLLEIMTAKEDVYSCLLKLEKHKEKGYKIINWRYEIMGISEKKEVESPEHYIKGDIECFAAIQAALTPEEFKGFLKGNVFKYIWRENWKGQDLDIQKALWYVQKLKEYYPNEQHGTLNNNEH